MSSMEEAFTYLKDFKVCPKTLLNIGANEGQEREIFRDFGIEKAAFVEPIPEVFARLQANISKYADYHAIQAVCTEKEGEEVIFNISSNSGESSSLYDLGKELNEFYPHLSYVDRVNLTSRTVDGLLKDYFPGTQFDMMVLDTQGSELKVLKGSMEALKHAKAVFTEVQEKPLYVGSCTMIDIMKFLSPLGFGMKWMKLNPHFYGDALFIRNT